MDFLELAKQRYSVRAYKSDPVEDEKLQKVLFDSGVISQKRPFIVRF